MPERPSSLAWGMAAPAPKPVEPSFSRALRAARMVRAGIPVVRAALAARCWNKAFLFAAGKPASTASTFMMSERSIIDHRKGGSNHEQQAVLGETRRGRSTGEQGSLSLPVSLAQARGAAEIDPRLVHCLLQTARSLRLPTGSQDGLIAGIRLGPGRPSTARRDGLSQSGASRG